MDNAGSAFALEVCADVGVEVEAELVLDAELIEIASLSVVSGPSAVDEASLATDTSVVVSFDFSSSVAVDSLSGGLGSSIPSFELSPSGAGDGLAGESAFNESMIAPSPPSSSSSSAEDFSASSLLPFCCPESTFRGLDAVEEDAVEADDEEPSASAEAAAASAACFCSPAIAALRSIGHTDALTYGGTCTSNVMHISMTC